MKSLTAFWLMLLLSANVALCASANSLITDTPLSTEGYFVLSWELGDLPTGSNYQLQQAQSPDFTASMNLDIERNGSVTLTGFPDGSYYFRAGLPGNWSGTVLVEVQHHSLARALAFFALGLALFLVLIFTIIRGNSSSAGASD